MNAQSWSRKTASLSLTMLAGLLPGCTTYVDSPGPATVYAPPPVVEPVPVYAAPPPQPPVVYVAPAPAAAPVPEPVVEIHAESDFYEPLRPYGRWLEVPEYGRCWAPARVDPDWRPYTDGHWQRTDAGWYWVSNEPWGWATCHYGRWHRDDNIGWVWIPQTQWAPAWVAWREGGGYTGWAPLPPEDRLGAGETVEHHRENLEPRSFVFVEQRRMLEPHRPQTVIVNNTTIINRTVNLTQVVVVNQTTINAGPRPEAVAQATGRQVEVVPAHTLRTRQEAPAVAEHLLHPIGPVNHLPPNAPPAHNPEGTPVMRPPVVRPNEPLATTPAASPPIVARPPAPTVYHEGRPPVTNHVVRPSPGAANLAPPTHSPEGTPVTRTPVLRPTEPVVANPAAPRPVVAPPSAPTVTHVGRPPVTNHVFGPTPKPPVAGPPTVQPGQVQPTSGQVPRPTAPEPIKRGPNSASNAPAGSGHMPAQPTQPPLTAQQKLERERKQKEAEKRRLEAAAPSSQPSTNPPVPSH